MKKPVIDRNRPLGLYLHIPFCKAKCAYCDFYSLPHSEEKMDAYAAALAGTSPRWPPRCRTTGGHRLFRRRHPQLSGPQAAYCPAENREEAVPGLGPGGDHPGGQPRQRRGLAGSAGPAPAGFNRISLGVQSSDDETLRRLGRVHTWQQVKDAVAACRKAGLDNISLDLIYGLPDQTLEQWENTLADALVLAPRHISLLRAEAGGGDASV